ncbi:MAG: type secretion system family protein [Anaerocolumna sp.]|jgi:type IV pilus assembly protein PilC|nr:type secretion system family protein [Anaerocolumna sp.]
MPNFTYVVIDNKGKEKKGTIEAVNEDKARANLKANGNFLISIAPQNALNKDINISFGNPIKSRDLSLFCRQFVSILSAGVPIVNALEMLMEQTENKVMSQGIKDVMASVEKGETLATAMRARGKIFPSILINMVEAGETSGNLETAFGRMAIHFEKETKLKAQVKKAMLYPAVVGSVAVGVIFIMMIFVIPNFMGMFADMDLEMPAMTQFVIDMSDFFKKYWYVLIGIIVLAVFGIKTYKKSPSGKVIFGRLGLSMPLFGALTRKSSSARFARTLSTLLASGVSMIDALEITSRTMDNEIVRDTLASAKEDVARGIPLSEPIKKSGVFPPMVCHMTKIGEETGNMESMLDKLADYYDEEVELTTQSLTAVMEPMIIIILALVVGVLIMAIMQPMLSMYNGFDNL